MIDYNKLDKSKVYVAFSQGDTVVSKTIRILTRSKFSHSFILYWSNQFQSFMAIGDNFNGWVFTPASTENTLAVATVPVDLWSGLQKNRDSLGSLYDYPALVGMLWVLFGKFIIKAKRQWKNHLDTANKYICSEICTKVIQDSGLALELLPASTDPQTLFDLLKLTPGVEFLESK